MNHFFAVLSRMKYIYRWSLMRNTYSENVSEHSLDVSIIAHALAVLRNKRFGGNVNPERAALLGIFHDVSEILTGDMPTPVKYYNEEISSSYKKVEDIARQKLLSYLPQDLKDEYKSLLLPQESDKELWELVRAADKIAALIKCMEEERAGNMEFSSAARSIKKIISDMKLKEADCFVNEFLPSYNLTLDEQK